VRTCRLPEMGGMGGARSALLRSRGGGFGSPKTTWLDQSRRGWPLPEDSSILSHLEGCQRSAAAGGHGDTA